ncbi:recombination protein U [Mycoplasmoides fastidiosum]|uniref:Holliday junction resolvase RecU n=1 Tax=Mycoplasmoides fastidiosum TaxID=92758 RepID=A0ABU0LYB0_9BACT|nr:Holliday junction resolvase RecU [Mycoplasmoides fastidiosum]MDQ0513665.1 recombination protein U [Mycoplasmoides fastidiosum]UUD38128.1 Holliday junction resolvase RecU [Mycoplasmoides fastidiosum]
MQFYQNRGMFTETLVNNTIDWYYMQNIAFFKKNHVPLKLNKIDKSNRRIYGQILKAGLDYYGLYQGQYIEFEVKETQQPDFMLTQLKKHQFYQMQRIEKFGGITFLILNFLCAEKIYFIPFAAIEKLKQEQIKKISLEWCQKNAREMQIHFPGIIKWLDFLNKK